MSGLPRGARHRQGLVISAVTVVAAAVCGTVILAVGSVRRMPGTGLAALDVRVSWLLPAARLVTDVSAAAAIGCLVAGAVLLPGGGTLSPAGYRWLLRATWPATVWAVAAAAGLPGLFVEFLYTDLGGVSAPALFAFIRDVPLGAAQASVAVLAGVVAVGSRCVLTAAGARVLLGLAALAVVAPVLGEYAEAEGTPVRIALAATGTVVHVLGALAWSGTLAALLFTRLPAGARLTAVGRYSRVAPLLLLAVGVGGFLSAAAVLDGPSLWWRTDYGRIVLLKVAALVLLAALGRWHRRRALPELVEGRTGAFRRIAAGELVVFAVAFGLAVGLSRTLDPVVEAGHVRFDATGIAAAADLRGGSARAGQPTGS